MPLKAAPAALIECSGWQILHTGKRVNFAFPNYASTLELRLVDGLCFKSFDFFSFFFLLAVVVAMGGS